MRAQVICIADYRTLRGVTWNISDRGIQVELPELPKKAIVQLTFRLPSSQAIIDLTGTVVWAIGRRHGIKLSSVREPSRELIRNFIAQRTESDQLN